MTLFPNNMDNVDDTEAAKETQDGGNFLGEITVPAGLFVGNQLTKHYKNRKSKKSKRVKKSKRSKRVKRSKRSKRVKRSKRSKRSKRVKKSKRSKK